MPTKSWNVGDVLTASDMNVWTVPIAAVKPADTGRVNNTVSNDPDLQLALAANASYDLTAMLQYKGAATGTGDGQVTINVPAGATGFFHAMRLTIAGPLAVGWDTRAFGTALNIGTNGTSNFLGCLIKATVTTTGAGTVAVAWGQNTTNAGTATTMTAGSTFTAQRVG